MASEEDCCCVLCGCTSLTSVLYDINGNSVLIESTLLDLEDIIFSLFLSCINNSITNYICEECKDQIVKFHIFKESAKQNLQSVGCFENAIQELREFFNKGKKKEHDYELECTETEFIIRAKPNSNSESSDNSSQYLLQEYEPIFEETSQMSAEFIEETDVDKFYASEEQIDDTDVVMHDAETEVFVKGDDDESEVRTIVDAHLEDSPKIYSCACGVSFLKETELKHHKIAMHSKKSTITHNSLQFACDACNIRFKEEKYSQIHEKAHESFSALIPHMPSFCCEECLMLFSNEEDLMTHGTLHENNREEGLERRCLVERASAFDDHFVKSESLSSTDENELTCREEPLLLCGHCGLKQTESAIKLHLLFFHTTVVCCPLDNRCFEGHKQVRQFAEHIKNKHPEIFEKKVEYVCTCCHLTFPTPFEKLAHMKMCDMKKFICEQHCGKRFKSEWLLKKHLNLVEGGGDARFSCSLCPKQCVSKSDLQIHMRSHTNERPYQCTICDKAFKTSANRSSHMDIHREDKVHSCKVCHQKFQTRPILRKHMKKHDESYQNQCICQICKHKSYINRTHLLRHIKSSHSQPELTIDKIDAFFRDYFAAKES